MKGWVFRIKKKINHSLSNEIAGEGVAKNK